MNLNARSLSNLEGVHPDLRAVVERAAQREPFLVTEGLRTLERQKKLKAAGKSRTLNSRHLTGHAVDLCDTDGCYDKPDMDRIAKAMKAAAIDLDIPIEWGGDWAKAWDTPHFQLPFKEYPASGISVARKVVEAVKTKPVLVPTALGTGAVAVPTEFPSLPSLPSPPDVSQVTAWNGFYDWVLANPILGSVLIGWLALCYFAPSLAGRLTWSQS